MIPHEIIERKRDGKEIGAEEMKAFFHAYLEESVSEYQMSAFLMAVYFRGLSPAELATLVSVMVGSGRVLDLTHLPGARVDKHSTGGVGDKVSLVLAPLAAEMGLFVPMMSGRGLGHTAGTLDKLEAIPGFRTRLSLDEFRRVLESTRCAMIGQTAEIAPLDRRLYDLRSVTGTVSSIPLIAASIMSKKLAEGLSALVLDVKAGSGAFITEPQEVLELARAMVEIGEEGGVKTVALITAMDRPLGRAVGNGLETVEALRCLAGEGPADVVELVVALAGEMAFLGDLVSSPAEGRRKAARVLEGGGPLERFARMVEAQGGDSACVSNPDRLPSAPVVSDVVAARGGSVLAVSPRLLGRGVVTLGGGRTRLGQEIDRTVGFEVGVRPGDQVQEGDLLGVVHARWREEADQGARILREAVELGEGPAPVPQALVSRRVTREGVEELSP